MNKNISLKLISGLLLSSIIGYTVPVFAYTKDETVYSKLDNSGNNYKTIVSTHIQNTEKEDLINDISDLLNIKNTSGDETYTQDGNIFTWNANKNDIYYQGETSKELPIECNVKYELDGKEVSADEIAGRSGNVKIILQYTNKEEKVIDLNGKKVKMYVPFVVVAGTVIKNENACDISVSSGKVINDGTKAIVVGMAMPGLKESLGLSDKDIDIPSNIEITMNAKDFESDSIFSFVTPKVLDEEDLSIFDKIDEVYSQVNILQNSSKQIEDGANTLKDGAITYSEKSKEFNNAMNQVSIGSSTLNNNYSKVDNGTKELKKGANALNNGVNQLSKGIETLDTGVNEAKEQIAVGLSNTSVEMKNSLQQLNVGVLNAVDGENNSQSITSIIKATNSAIKSNLNLKLESTLNQKIDETVKMQVKQALANKNITDSDTVEYILASINTKQTINTVVDGTTEAVISLAEKSEIDNVKKVATGIDNTLQSAKEQITNAINEKGKEIVVGFDKLQSGTDTLKTSVNNQLLKGTKDLVSGTQTLSEGSSQVKEGLNILDNGTNQLNSASKQLTDGASTLAEGATDLADGIKIFNKEGIERICNYINGDAKDLMDRVEILTELSKNYNNFTMIDDKNDGNVKFIMIIDGIKKQQESEQKKEEAILQNNVDLKE